jgi:hypothetical protein
MKKGEARKRFKVIIIRASYYFKGEEEEEEESLKDCGRRQCCSFFSLKAARELVEKIRCLYHSPPFADFLRRITPT